MIDVCFWKQNGGGCDWQWAPQASSSTPPCAAEAGVKYLSQTPLQIRIKCKFHSAHLDSIAWDFDDGCEIGDFVGLLLQEMTEFSGAFLGAAPSFTGDRRPGEHRPRPCSAAHFLPCSGQTFHTALFRLEACQWLSKKLILSFKSFYV